MRSSFRHPALILYGLAWQALLPALRALAVLDRKLWAVLGRGCLPMSWQAEGRLLRVAADGELGNTEDTVWMHCASLGEAKGLWAAAQALPQGRRIVFTANTAAGLDFLRQRSQGRPELRAAIAPFDHPALVSRFLDRHDVRCLCLYEVELWPHYISSCSARRIPVLLISARLPPRIRPWARDIRSCLLDRLTWIQAQSVDDVLRLQTLTRTPVEPGFDLKAAHYFREAPPPSARKGFAFISLHLRELDFFLPVLPALMESFPIRIFPRRLSELPGFQASLRRLGFALHSEHPTSPHLLVDSFGKVGGMLPDCHSAFVGGSLVEEGCHNLWEPLAAGLKLYFGPHYHSQEASARLLLGRGLAEVILEKEQCMSWGEPGPEHASACRVLIAELQGNLQSALDRFSARIVGFGGGNPGEAQPAQVSKDASRLSRI